MNIHNSKVTMLTYLLQWVTCHREQESNTFAD